MDKAVVVAALYIRNSDSSKMDTEVQKAQEEALRKYAKEHGYEVREHLVFKEAISAIKVPYWERKELLRLWDESERGSFDVVLVTEMFRLARYASEQFAVIEHLKRYNVRVESISEKFEDTAEGRLLMSIQGFLGEVEANKIAIRTSRGRFHRAKQALSGQGQPAYGYVWGNTHDYRNAFYMLSTRLFTDNEGREWTEVRIVEWTYEHCLDGWSLRQMAMTLTQIGIPTREGKEVWGVTTLRKILTDKRYTGIATACIEGEEREITGLIPRIVSDDDFARVQVQLGINAELSPRNNHRPKDTAMRGLVYCGVCGRKMHVKHYFNAHGNKTQQSAYKCFRNDGIDTAIHKHTVSISCDSLDEEAWTLAKEYIRNPCLIHEYIKDLQEQIPDTDHEDSLEETIAKIDRAITNLYKLAEVAIDAEPLQERLIELQLKRRDLEKLHMGVVSTKEKQEQLRAALDRFECWAASQRAFLDDPDYDVTPQDKTSAVQFLGIKATILPEKGNAKRVKLELMPPDLDRVLRSWYRG